MAPVSYSTFLRVLLTGAIALLIMVGGTLVTGCRQLTAVPAPLSSDGFLTGEVARVDPPLASLSLAVTPLVNLGEPSTPSWIGPTLTELLISDLARFPQLRVVSRQALNAILREQWIQHRTAASEELVRPGRLQGAEILLLGGYWKQGAQIMVDLKLVDVETGVVEGVVQASGTIEEFPVLEEYLVHRILARLEGWSDKAGKGGREGPSAMRVPSAERLELEGSGRAPFERLGDAGPVFPAETYLTLQKATQDRLTMMQAGQALFDEDVIIEMGHPRPRIEESSEFKIGSMSRMEIPVSVFLKADRIRRIFTETMEQGGASRVHVSHKTLSINTKELPEGPRLFMDQFLSPRRLFVRARVNRGEVMAVFSEFHWRTDRSLILEGVHQVMVPAWPNPFLTGTAEFPLRWIDRDDASVTFDAVFIPAIENETDVTVEWIESPEQDPLTEETTAKQNTLGSHLRQWIRERWLPPIAETLPLPDYLPGNKRTAQLILHIVEGTVSGVRIQSASRDPLFDRSLQILKDLLVGHCVWCQAQSTLPDIPQTADLRVQCTLMKEIGSTSLGLHPVHPD
jgi:TolB-like protein